MQFLMSSVYFLLNFINLPHTLYKLSNLAVQGHNIAACCFQEPVTSHNLWLCAQLYNPVTCSRLFMLKHGRHLVVTAVAKSFSMM